MKEERKVERDLILEDGTIVNIAVIMRLGTHEILLQST